MRRTSLSLREPRSLALILAVALALLRPLAVPAADSPAPRTPAPESVPPPKDLGELKGIEDKAKQAIARVLPSTVCLRIGASQGSGIIVSKEGYVLTAGHVVAKPGQKVVVVLPNGKTVNGTTLGVSSDTDAGLAKITDQGDWPAAEMAKAGSVRPGSWCMALGHPLGLQDGRPPVVRLGRVLQVRDSVIRSDCVLVAGDSGGPLIDLEGRVIGINSRINAGVASMNFHVPIDVFHQSWDRLVKGEMWQTYTPGKDSSEVKTVFQQVVVEAGRCVVRVKCDTRDVALGTIVGPDGWIVTKASQLKGQQILCRLRDGKEFEARLVGVHEPFDLAMLKIDAKGLPLLPWAGGGNLDVGQWVATPGLQDGPPLALGVVGVPPRRIPPTAGVLGITLAEPETPAKILKIQPDSPAQKAGLQENDIITHVNDKPTNSRPELVSTLRSYRLGTTVKVTIKRGDKVLEITATLGRIETPSTRKRDMQNLSPPGVNERCDDFPRVLQHDTVLTPTDCGGPVVDLSGKVVGVNIARAGRTETYSVPTDVLLPLLYELISGRLPPPVKPEPKVEAKPETKPEQKPQPKQEAKPEGKPKEEIKPEPKPEAKPEPKPEAKPQAEKKPEGKPEPTPAPKVDQQPAPKAEPKPEPKPELPKQPGNGEKSK